MGMSEQSKLIALGGSSDPLNKGLRILVGVRLAYYKGTIEILMLGLNHGRC
jgi:hypothetical protein